MAFIDFLRRVDLAFIATPSKEEKRKHLAAVERFKQAFNIEDGKPFVRPDGQVLYFTGVHMGGSGKTHTLADQANALDRAVALKAKITSPASGFTPAQQVIINEILELTLFQ